MFIPLNKIYPWKPVKDSVLLSPFNIFGLSIIIPLIIFLYAYLLTSPNTYSDNSFPHSFSRYTKLLAALISLPFSDVSVLHADHHFCLEDLTIFCLQGPPHCKYYHIITARWITGFPGIPSLFLLQTVNVPCRLSTQ